MLFKRRSALFAAALLMCASATAQTWHWANQIGNANDDKFSFFRTDDQGNSYVAGYFTGTLTLGSKSMVSAGSTDIFIAKYNSSGVLQWAESAGSTGSDNAYYINFDGNGDAYLAGTIQSASGKFGSSITLGSSEYGAFIAKISSSGTWSWAEAANGGTFTSVAVDGNGNIYAGGYGPKNWQMGSVSISTNEGTAGFLVKLSSSGVPAWAKKLVNNSAKDVLQGINAVELDGHGNVITAGHSQGIGGSVAGLYLCKFDANGNLIWLKYSPGSQYDSKFNGIIYDKEYDKIYFSGLHPSNTNIDFGDAVKTTNKGAFGFLVKFDSSGLTEKILMTSDSFVTPKFTITGMSHRLDGKYLYLSGELGNQKMETVSGMTLEPQTGIFGYSRDALVLKLDTNGLIVEAANKTGGNNEFGYGVDVLSAGKAVVAGEFTTYQSYIANFGSYTFSSAGKIDMFVAAVTTEFIERKVPIANFRYSQKGLKVWFTDMSEKTPTTWEWNFGDGSPKSTSQNPMHTYSAAGTYNVCLKAANADGDNTKCITIEVSEAEVDMKGLFAFNSGDKLFNPVLGVSGTDVIAGGTLNQYYKTYRSPDNGDNWLQTPLNKTLGFVSEGPGGNLYAGAERRIVNTSTWVTDTLYISDDGGQSWTLAAGGEISRAFSFDGIGNIYGSANGGTGADLKKSSDDGVNFSVIYTGNAMSSGVAPNGNLLVGTYNSGIYYSTDGGANWTQSQTNIGNITIGPFYTYGNAVYTATYFGLYRSTDNGASFDPVTPDPAITMTVSNFILTKTGEFFITSPLGFFYSEDGVKFTRVLGIPAFSAFAANDDYLFAASQDSVYRIALKNMPGLTPPAAPGNLTAIQTQKQNDGKMKLEWNDNADNEEGFVLQRTLDTTTTWTFVDSLGADIETFTDTGLADGVWHYRLYAYNSAGNSGYSNSAEGTITSGVTDLDIPGLNTWQVYPNPSKGIARLRIESAGPVEITIKIHDLQGRLLYTRSTGMLHTGTNDLLLHDFVPSKGVYTVSLQTKGNVATQKLVVVD